MANGEIPDIIQPVENKSCIGANTVFCFFSSLFLLSDKNTVGLNENIN